MSANDLVRVVIGVGSLGQVPNVREIGVRIAGNEQFLATVGLVDGALHRADVGAVDMNADRHLVVEGIADLMNIVAAW